MTRSLASNPAAIAMQMGRNVGEVQSKPEKKEASVSMLELVRPLVLDA